MASIKNSPKVTLVRSPYEQSYFAVQFINAVYCFFFPAENGGCPISAVSELAAAINDNKQLEDYKNDNGNSNTKGKANTEESDLPERY